MQLLALFVGTLLAVFVIAWSYSPKVVGGRAVMRWFALAVFLTGLAFSTVTYVPSDRVGVVTKNMFGSSLREGRIVAVNGEMGPQADALAPGLHFWFWPFVYTVRTEPLTVIESGKIGIVETTDGLPLDPGQLFAPEWTQADFERMQDARFFLTNGNGRKGKQASVLTPGTYRLNPLLYKVKMVDQTEILQGEVGVVKANFGSPATEMVDAETGRSLSADEASKLPDERVLSFAREGEMGIRRDVLRPGKYPINTDAFTVVELYSSVMIAHYTAANAGPSTPRSGAMRDAVAEESDIRVTTSDGFKFPVDVRIEYVIEAVNAPVVVATLGDDEGERFRNVMNSAVRAIFRNNAEKVRALDYVQQRSIQESQSLTMLASQMARFGVKVTAVRIGEVGDETSLGALLKTQTDRELAKQEQTTFQEQQKAAEQKKQLARTQQESDEEKKLATAAYSVKIAAETQKQKVTEAQGEAEAITIKAIAQADAYKQIAEQIGKGNAAMIELLKIVGEKGIQITPRIMVTGGAGGTLGSDSTTAALMGTMLDQMVKEEDAPRRATNGPQK
ncbi:MAG TPA: SPFH domain-containing protein [Phycisphaerales bacterium]|nr:SPFH domain-containing protein [Phycisphaerales bacterium]